MLSKNVICLIELGFSNQTEMCSITDKDIVIAFSINKELVGFKDFLTHYSQRRFSPFYSLIKKTGRFRKLTNNSFYASSTGHGMINCLTPFIVSTNILESILLSMDKHIHLAKIRNIEKKWNSLPIFLN